MFFILFVCLILWYNEIKKPMRCHAPILILLESSLQGGVHEVCFVAFGPTVWKLLDFKVYMNMEIELNRLLILKNHNFHTTCPNTTKQCPCTHFYRKLSICAKFYSFSTYNVKVMIFLLKNWIKLILIWKKHNFYVACINAKPLHSFIHKAFYSHQKCNLSNYSVKMIKIQKF